MARHNIANIHKKFGRRLCILEAKASKIRSQIGQLPDWEIAYLTETLIGDLWQTWCKFSRDLLHRSCRGCSTRTGNVVLGRAGDNSWQRIGYEAANAGKLGGIKPNKQIATLRNEPTWGDQGKIIDIIKVLKPANLNVLLTGFGLPLLGPKHLQIVRNACAHKNVETMRAVYGLRLNYGFTRVSCPAMVAWEIESQTKLFAIYSWIDDLEQIGHTASV